VTSLGTNQRQSNGHLRPNRMASGVASSKWQESVRETPKKMREGRMVSESIIKNNFGPNAPPKGLFESLCSESHQKRIQERGRKIRKKGMSKKLRNKSQEIECTLQGLFFLFYRIREKRNGSEARKRRGMAQTTLNRCRKKISKNGTSGVG